jgi:hypothetical protein
MSLDHLVAQPLERAASSRLLAQTCFPEPGAGTGCQSQQRRLRLLEEWKREELQRTPFAILDELPPYDDLSLEHPVKARWSKKARRRGASTKA